MIFPKDEAEGKKFEKAVAKNEQAGDWVDNDLPVPGQPEPSELTSEDILKQVGDDSLRRKK